MFPLFLERERRDMRYVEFGMIYWGEIKFFLYKLTGTMWKVIIMDRNLDYEINLTKW